MRGEGRAVSFYRYLLPVSFKVKNVNRRDKSMLLSSMISERWE